MALKAPPMGEKVQLQRPGLQSAAIETLGEIISLCQATNFFCRMRYNYGMSSEVIMRIETCTIFLLTSAKANICPIV